MFFLNGVLILLLFCVLVTVNAQLQGQLQFAVKSGTCPTDICVSVFDNGCSSDLTCPGDFKCCPNNCGHSMCYPPKTIDQFAPQQEQPLHVSFVQNGGMEFGNHCYYNSKWYSAGQNLISRSGDVCTCVNRDKITCTRPNNNNNNQNNFYTHNLNNNLNSNNYNGNNFNNFNTNNNNNANSGNNGQRLHQNSPGTQANFRMGPDTWQSSLTTMAPPQPTTHREATPQPAKIFIQNINNNQVMNGLGGDPKSNGQMYNSLGDHKMTQTPAFFHASPVKEAQSNGVINGHVNFHDPFEPASTHAHQSLYDKGFPSIANKPLYVQDNSHKTESNGPYKPIMDGNVNFGLPSKEAGNVWMGPLTTEISVMQEVGSAGGSQHQGQSMAQEYNPWGVTQTYENTGFSKNVVENIELGLLESQTQGFASSDFNAAFFGGQEQPQDVSNQNNQNNGQSYSIGQFHQQIAMPPTNINQNYNQQSTGGFPTNNVQYQNNPSGINTGMGHSSDSNIYQPMDRTNFQSSHQMYNADNHNGNPQSVFGGSNQYDGQYPRMHGSNLRMQEMGSPYQQPDQGNHYQQPHQGNPFQQPVQQTHVGQQPWSNQREENANQEIFQQWAPKDQTFANGPAVFHHDQSKMSNVQQMASSGNIQNLNEQPRLNNIWDNAEDVNQYNKKNKPNIFSIIPNQNENLSLGSKFTFGSGKSQSNVQNAISFEAIRSQSDLRRINSKIARPQFSLNKAEVDQPTQIETPMPPRQEIPEKTTAKPIETTEILKPRTKADIDIQPAVDEIVIETTIPPKTSTQSFIQFLQFVLEQRELVKSKAVVKASETIDTSELVKSKTAAPTTKIPVKIETEAPATQMPVKSTTSAPLTAVPSQSTSTAAPTTQKLTTESVKTTTVPITSTAEAIKTTSAKTTTSAKATTTTTKPVTPAATPAPKSTTAKTTKINAGPAVVSSKPATTASATTTTSPTPAVTTSVTKIATTVATTSKITSIEPTTAVNIGKIPSTLRSLLADIEKQTTVRIKFRKSQDTTPEISIEYVTPSPKKDEKQSLKQMATSTAATTTTTFKYGPNQGAQKISFKNPLQVESKDARIKIVNETPSPKIDMTTANPGITPPGVPNEKSGGLTNSHFSHYQYTDSSPSRMDVLDYSRDIPLNAKQTTTVVPAETPAVYSRNSNNYGPQINAQQQKFKPEISKGRPEEEALPSNATFFQRILFMKRQMAARENPVAALKKFGDPSANMLNLIKLLPKNNNSPMAATNEAALFTSKVEPPARKTTSRNTATTPAPKEAAETAGKSVSGNTKTRVDTHVRNEPPNSKGNPRNAQRKGAKTATVTSKGRRPKSNKAPPKAKRNKNQCIYLGKVYRAGQRFKNNKGQRCKCQRGGRVRCRK